jgi:hypothetical protein
MRDKPLINNQLEQVILKEINMRAIQKATFSELLAKKSHEKNIIYRKHVHTSVTSHHSHR